MADLVSGTAEVVDGTLLLKAELREPLPCTMRVFLDTIPEVGYKGDGADYLIENATLSRFAAENPSEWKWAQGVTIPFRQEGTLYSWEVPMNIVRPATAARFRIRFQARTNAGTDEMPSYGKVFPILRPGNLAAEPTTQITVSSCAPMYKSYPLVDGQTSRRIHWCFESWASSRADPLKIVEFAFPAARPVHQMLVWWEELPISAEVQLRGQDGQWTTLISQKGDSNSGMADWVDAEVGAPIVEPDREKLRQAQKNIFPFPAGTATSALRITAPKDLWIREIEIY